MRTRCTHCGQGLTLKKPELAGRKVACPSCRQPFVVRPVTPRKASARRSAPPADDDVLDADIIDAEEVDEPSGGDDDWLDALDSLPPVAPAGASTAAVGEAPRVSKPSRKKKSSSGGKSKKRRRLRDPDGELPLWLHRLLMVASGIVAGVIATLLWAAMISASGSASRYMAILVGVFVGTAVRFGASKWDFGWGPALTASGIAFVSIFAGKITGYHMLKHQEAVEMEEHNTAYLAMLQHEDYPISEIAWQMELDRFDAGLFDNYSDDADWADQLTKSDGSPDWSEIYKPENFPQRYAATWEAAQQRWEQMPDDEKDERREAIEQEIAYFQSADLKEYQEAYRDLDTNIFGTRIITPFDFFFAIFAIVAAFKIAAGMTDDDE